MLSKLSSKEPFSKTEIIQVLGDETSAVHDYFAALPEAEFFEAPASVWTPADNLVHLIKSASPVVTALKLPKVALRLRFGKAKHTSRSLAEVRAAYMAFANAGTAIATGGYVPEVESKSAEERERILQGWVKKNRQLISAVDAWQDADLDTLVLPHPLLGNMTLREILLFTVYHNMHHVNDVQRVRVESETEWF